MLLSGDALVEKARGIRLAAFDVDGVLTDGNLYYGEGGEDIKKFHVRDGVGLKMLMKHNIEVAVISAKDSAAVRKRLEDLGVCRFFLGACDKLSILEALCGELGISIAETAYVGDDVIDIKVMKKVGLPIAVRDAYSLVLDASLYVTSARGGHGAGREVADLLISSRMDLLEAYEIAMAPSFEHKGK
ncbi:MAG: HAD-IIIA family hydrolase [Oligoflexales bacterium]|nr:HAD-IIIA family hydrolase [Oligoflexales bacterium]